MYGDFAERMKNYSRSLSLVVKYPVTGCYFLGKTGGGGHSFIMDSIGNFGWGIAWMNMYLMLRKPFVIGGRRRKNSLDIGVFMAWLVFLFLDPLTQELAIAFFLIFPFTQFLVNKKQEAG